MNQELWKWEENIWTLMLEETSSFGKESEKVGTRMKLMGHGP